VSAFFNWDTAVVADAILKELAKQGRSVHPDAYEFGMDDWGDTVKINLPEMQGLEYYTDMWDVNVWDNDGVFTVTAYPMCEKGRTDCSSWITLIEHSMKEDE
jgi:hypothetical protein